MNIKQHRLIIPSNGPDVSTIKTGLTEALKIIASNPQQFTELLILVSGKNNVLGTTIESALGSDLVKKLLKQKSLKSKESGLTITLETERTLFGAKNHQVVLAIYPGDKLLNKLDDSYPGAVVVVPWLMDTIEQWKKTWNVSLHGQMSIKIEDSLHPVLKRTLEQLTNTVNLSTGLAHPSDKSAAVQLVKSLHKNRIPLDSDEIKTWCQQHGWSTKGAGDLKAIVDSILEGKRLRTGDLDFGWDKTIKSLLK